MQKVLSRTEDLQLGGSWPQAQGRYAAKHPEENEYKQHLFFHLHWQILFEEHPGDTC